MKFDKFGAFPKSEGVEEQTNSKPDMMTTFLKLLPNLFKRTTSEEKKPQNDTRGEETASKLSPDAIAYREYLAKHDAHVRLSKGK